MNLHEENFNEMDIKNRVRKKITEIREENKSSLIKEQLTKKRIFKILNEVRRYDDIRDMSIRDRKKISYSLFLEIHKLHNLKVVNEGIWDQIKEFLGSLGVGTVEGAIAEPLVNSILSKLGLGGYFKNVLISFFTTNPEKLTEAYKDCESMTKIIAEVITEATFMMIQKSVGLGGIGYSVIRNSLANSVKKDTFIQDIEEGIANVVCSNFENIRSKLTQTFGDKE